MSASTAGPSIWQPTAPTSRSTRRRAPPQHPLKTSHMLEIDNRFHRLAFEFCGMEEHFDHMLSTFKHIERLRLFSLMLEENFSVPGQHGKIVDALEAGDPDALERPSGST